ncbi:MAG: sulfite exporter TauE/SafE family protein [Clostridia bacterium]|nr:sulfite exporter TauE/SafE family protein [Clostridia bacterium]
MKQKLLIKKSLIRANKTLKHKLFKFKTFTINAKIKGEINKKVFKLGNNVKTQLLIVKPTSIIQPRKKIRQKLLKTNINQANLIYDYKLKQNLNKSIKSKNVFYLNKKQNNVLKVLWLLLIGVFIGFVNGFWGGGGGMICVPTLTSILKLPEKKAHATAILIMLPLSVASFVVYMLKGTLQWLTAGYVTLGFIFGGVAGALLLKNINNTILKVVFSLVIIAGAIKLLV